MSGADPGFFLGGGALLSCLTSTPINHIVFFFCRIPVVLESCRSSQNGPWVWDVSNVVMYKLNGLTVDIPEGWGVSTVNGLLVRGVSYIVTHTLNE